MSIKSRKQREKAQRREAILSSAQRVFLRDGYQGTTMERIASEAELSKGTLYLYFESKYEIYAELSDRQCAVILLGFESASTRNCPGRQMVAKMLEHWVEVSSSNISQFRLAVGFFASDERPETSPATSSHQQTIIKIISELANAVARGHADGSIRLGVAPVTTACQLWSGMMGAMIFHSRSQVLMETLPIAIDSKNFMNNHIELLCAGLGVDKHESYD